MVESKAVCIAHGDDSTDENLAIAEHGRSHIFSVRNATEVAPPKYSSERGGGDAENCGTDRVGENGADDTGGLLDDGPDGEPRLIACWRGCSIRS